jgi:hypothetical protein
MLQEPHHGGPLDLPTNADDLRVLWAVLDRQARNLVRACSLLYS